MMLRRLLTLLSAASLLPCAAACVLWTRSYRGPAGAGGDGFVKVWAGTRYTVTSRAGRVTVTGPPPGPPEPDPALRATLQRIGNADLGWVVAANDGAFRDVVSVSVVPRGASAGSRAAFNGASVSYVSDADARVPTLMAALEDPGRFAAAHYGLCEIARTRGGRDRQTFEARPDGSILVVLDGLDIELRGPPTDPRVDSSDTHFADFAATVDPGQQPAVRDRWHRRLDVPLRSVPWWPAAAATGVLPAAWAAAAVARAIRSRARRRSRVCPGCGYDLRASPGRCPECGAEPKGATA